MQEDVREQVEGIFNGQSENFLNFQEDIPFAPLFHLDEHQVFHVETTNEMNVALNLLFGDGLDAGVVDIENLENEGIKALATCDDANQRAFIQTFVASQRLDTKFALFRDGNVFRRLATNAFTLGSSLACVVEENFAYFRSFHLLRMIFDMKETYRDLTHEEVIEFANHQSLLIDNPEGFADFASEPIRRLIQSVRAIGILEQIGVGDLQQMAQATGLELAIENNRIVMPPTYAEVLELLHFLNDDRWRSILTDHVYITNSKMTLQ